MPEFRFIQRRHWIPLAVFAVCTLAMWLVWQALDVRLLRSQRNQFVADTQLLTTRIGERMVSSVYALRGMAAFFTASDGNVTRAAWRRYAWEWNLDQTPRGVQVMGFIRMVPQAKRAAYVAGVRREGYAHFDIWPGGMRDAYSSTHFVEPFENKGHRLLGYDMLSDPVRRQAMEQARDTGAPVFSGRVRLFQENYPPGVLVFYPVYNTAVGEAQTPEARRESLVGWVFLVFRMHELMDALLGQQWQDMRVEVFDGDETEAEALLYDSLEDTQPPAAPVFQQTTRLQLAGRVWTLRYSALPAYEGRLNSDTSRAVLGSMVLISLLLFGMTWVAINTRQRAERIAERLTRSLSASEGRYRSIFSHAGVASLLVDPAGCTVVEANEAAVRYYGIAGVDMRGMPLTTLVRLDDDALRAVLAEAVSGRNNYMLQQHRLKNGEVREVEMQAGPVEVDGRTLLHCAITDITERRAAEAAVIDLNRRYQSLLDAASEVSIVATDADGLITLFNSGAERLLGYRASEMVGRMTPVAFHDPLELRARALELSAQLGCPVGGFHVFTEMPRLYGFEQREWSYVRKNGVRCRVSSTVTPVRDAEGGVVGYLSIAIDISRLKEAEASLLHAKEAAEQASRAKSTFLATMSHEIRTPMNGVIGMAQLLQGTHLTPEQHEYAEIIVASAESLLIIINDILDLSKVEAGKLELEQLPFELGPLLAGVVGMFLPQARAHGIDLRLETDAALPPWLVGDAVRLRQVVVNLLGNAVKFTEHGSIQVSVDVLAPDAGAVPNGAERIAITVRDTGVGMAPEVVRGLFTPFYQGDSSITRRFGGTGLGLSITHGLVELMGGEIKVESALGVGSAFTVMLSLHVPEEMPAHANEVLADGMSAGMMETGPARVLIVDDTLTNQKVAQRLLAKLGLESDIAGNGEQAVRMLAAGKYDLVLMDCQMPVMDGFAATRLIRSGIAGERNRRVPVIAMTANALDGDRERCLQSGMNDYMPKPVLLEALGEKISYWLAAREGESPGEAEERKLPLP